jgi:chorismate mutase
MSTRGIRGATHVRADAPDIIIEATRELLLAIVDANPTMHPEDVASIFFTSTPDLVSAHPALAARQLGWSSIPLLCAQEIPVPDSLERVIRVLVHWNTETPQTAIQHVYLHEAACLRPDLSIQPLAHPQP